jgi:hypothetical protein
MHESLAWRLVGALALLGAGCTKNEIAPHAQGGAGESCASRNDCKDGLACTDNRCVKPGATSKQKDSGTAMPVVDAGGGRPGESCTRRADCQTGNACIDDVCVSEAELPMGTVPSTRGDRGESCRARNDCMDGLACINQVCIEADIMFTVSTKQCVRVQCETDQDCCENFVAAVNCASMQKGCKSNHYLCPTFYSQCKCNQVCQANMCTPVTMCMDDTNCGTTQRCLSGVCAQCKTSTDCTGSDQQCVAGVCRAPCMNNEQCPLFSECQSGKCVAVGCKSDRECYFETKNQLSQCKDTKCITPCTEDAMCGDFQVCNQGQCVFVGCETDEECRAMLNVQNVPGGDRAVCREPDK